MITILSIDPGIASVGWALLDLSGRRPRCVNAGTIHTDAKLPDATRLTDIARHAGALITYLIVAIDSDHRALVVEDQTNLHHAFGERGVTNTKALLCRDAQHRISGVAEGRNIGILPIAPQTWRARLGLGKATDAQIKAWVRRMVDGVPERLSIHAAEAICIGVAGARELRRRRKAA